MTSVLYQRGIYPPEDFKVVKKYGLNVLVTTDEEVKGYIKRIMGQLSRTVLTLNSAHCYRMDEGREDIQVSHGNYLQRYGRSFRTMAIRCTHLRKTFPTISTVHPLRRPIRERKSRVCPLRMIADDSTNRESLPEKTESEIHAEIQAIIRQITASVTFLPMLEGRCTFNVLVYADADANVPDEEWGDSDAKEVKNAENVKLRSFSTMNHRIDTMVSYRLDAEEY